MASSPFESELLWLVGFRLCHEEIKGPNPHRTRAAPTPTWPGTITNYSTRNTTLPFFPTKTSSTQTNKVEH
jgi:hypothetical protein